MKKLFFAAMTLLAFSNARAQGTVTTPPTQDDKQADISFETTTKDFGTVPEGPEAVYVFKFKNTGNAPLVLSHVQASCGCTTPEWSKEPVMPGQTGEIKAVFNTNGRLGVFNKTITVTSNAKSGATVQLTIMGTVVKADEYKPPVKVEPAPKPAPAKKPAKKPAGKAPARTNKDAAKPKNNTKPVPTTGS